MQTFELAPIAAKPMWWSFFILAVVGVLTVLALLLLLMLRSTPRIAVGPEGLRVHNPLFGREIPLSRIDAAGARRIDLAREPDLAPKWRTMGVGLPGYQLGWYRLQNGDKALLFVTRPGEVVYIPTRDDYALMVSPKDPEAFLASLRTAGR